jgi:hypothetical protein
MDLVRWEGLDCSGDGWIGNSEAEVSLTGWPDAEMSGTMPVYLSGGVHPYWVVLIGGEDPTLQIEAMPDGSVVAYVLFRTVVEREGSTTKETTECALENWVAVPE